MYVRTESEKEDISMKCVCVSCFLRTYFIDQKKTLKTLMDFKYRMFTN